MTQNFTSCLFGSEQMQCCTNIANDNRPRRQCDCSECEHYVGIAED